MMSNKKLLHFALLVFLFVSLGRATAAESPRTDNWVVWKRIAEGFEIAENKTWILPQGSKPRKFIFSAIRFNFGKYQIKLLSVADFSVRYREQIARDQKIDPNSSAIFDLGLGAIYNVNPFNASVLALAPAGFPASERKPIHLGLLKIDRKTVSPFVADGPSAVLCLTSPAPAVLRLRLTD